MASDAVVHLIDDDDGVRQAVAFLLTTIGFRGTGLRIGRSVFLDALPSLAAGLHRHRRADAGDGWPGTCSAN